jgi:hypothetical protein
MNRLVQACLALVCSSASLAHAVMIDAQAERSLLEQGRVVEIVRQNLQDEIAIVTDLEPGGKHRLFVRAASRHLGPRSWIFVFHRGAAVTARHRCSDAAHLLSVRSFNRTLENCTVGDRGG